MPFKRYNETSCSIAKRGTNVAKKNPGAGKVSNLPTVQVRVRPTTHRVRKSLLALLAIVVAHAWLYLVGAFFFSTHFVPGTTLNGRNVSWSTQEQLSRQIEEEASSYTDTIVAGDLSLTIRGEDIGMQVDALEAAQSAMGQLNPLMWPMYLVHPPQLSVEAGTTFDEELLRQYVGAAVDEFNAGASRPQDATLTFDDESKTYVVEPAKAGTALNRDAVVAAAVESASVHSTEAELGEEALVQPKRTADAPELVDAAAQANALLDQDISLTLNGDEQAHVSRDQLAAWVRVGDDLQVSLDEEAVAAWTQDALYDVALGSDDEYDYALDADSTTYALVSAIREEGCDEVTVERYATRKEPEVVEEQTAQTAPTDNWNSSLGRYIDVDLANQYARLYDKSGSVLWESYVVSGNSGEGRNTPVGTYAIYSKQTDTVLIGNDEDGDGQPDYRSHVNFWMPFSGGYGLHDATWREAFGGDIYSYDGSHGCVNLPYDAAASLFALANVGDTVVVHW